MSTPESLPGPLAPWLTRVNNRLASGIILALSLAVFVFLFWLIYFRDVPGTRGTWAEYLPALNATLNAISATCVALGVIAIKREKKMLHISLMISATAASAVFLVSYITYHSMHGDTKFLAQGLIRPIYFFILISHIILSMVVVPLIFSTLFFAASAQYNSHRKIAAWTFPIWLYVSITGVLVYVLQQLFNK